MWKAYLRSYFHFLYLRKEKKAQSLSCATSWVSGCVNSCTTTKCSSKPHIFRLAIFGFGSKLVSNHKILPFTFIIVFWYPGISWSSETDCLPNSGFLRGKNNRSLVSVMSLVQLTQFSNVNFIQSKYISDIRSDHTRCPARPRIVNSYDHKNTMGVVTLNDILCHRLMYFLTSLPLTYSLALMYGRSGIWLCQQIHNSPLLICHISNKDEEGASK